jgi:putative ABC transport system substrate-binding protein
MKRNTGHRDAGLRRRVGADAPRRSTRRKLLISFVAGVLVPLVSLAQTQKVWRIGILSPRTKTSTWDHDLFGAFLKGLSDLGYTEGRNIAVLARFADGKTEPLQALAAELVALKVDVIVTVGTPPVRAAQLVTTSIPIVTTSFADPVASGFAVSLSRPGRNITGLSNMGEELYAKRLEILAAVVPKVTRIAWLVNPDNAATMRLVPGLQAAAKKTGKEIVVANARGEHELAEAFSFIVERRVGALIVADDGVLIAHGARIAELATRNKLPSMFAQRQVVEAGGLISYGVDSADAYYRAATFVDKIFKGAKPGDLPIEQPAKFRFAVNLKTAKALGITLPPSILISADTVIE